MKYVSLAAAALLTIAPLTPLGARMSAAQETAQPFEPASDAARDTPTLSGAPASGTGAGGKAIDPQIHDLSPWRMFMGADIVVKGVMVGLAFASLVTWSVLFAKMMEIGFAKGRLRRSLAGIDSSVSLEEAARTVNGHRTVVTELLDVSDRELALSSDLQETEGVKERIASVLAEVVKAEAARIRRGMGLLATIGSTAPFVGLFGTVWGIMNSFIGISKSQTTNLAVVAPGIAEALLATAIGLVAAIPAVIFYNHFSRETRTYAELLMRASGAVARLVSRDLDRHRQVADGHRRRA